VSRFRSKHQLDRRNRTRKEKERIESQKSLLGISRGYVQKSKKRTVAKLLLIRSHVENKKNPAGQQIIPGAHQEGRLEHRVGSHANLVLRDGGGPLPPGSEDCRSKSIPKEIRESERISKRKSLPGNQGERYTLCSPIEG